MPEFEQILVCETPDSIGLTGHALQQLATLGLERLAVLGGGQLVAMLAVDLIDEIWLTVCPLILGGTTAPHQ